MNFHAYDIVLLSFLLSCVSAFVPGPIRYSPAMRPPVAQQVERAQTVMQAAGLETATEAKESAVPGATFIDVDALLAKSTFAIKPDDLVKLTKDILVKDPFIANDPDVLAENFEFCAPVVGPLPKDDYVGALKNFNLLDSFPDLDPQFYNIHVDPWEPNRVWWFTRSTATHTGPLLGKPATGKKLELPPQANSFTFNEAGKITQMTIGYVLDRRVGNTGGLGGAFAFLYATGNALPIPECQPFKKSLPYEILGLAGKVAKLLPKNDRRLSLKEETVNV